jgi:predicted metal-dependent HD superfamily phosphohydrolase
MVDILFLAREWASIHRAEEIRPSWMEFFRILWAYSSKGRFYHTLKHLEHGLRFIANNHANARAVHIAKLAYFYHDIVYNATREDHTNEEDSAEAFIAYTRAVGFSSDTITHGVALIYATKNHFADHFSNRADGGYLIQSLWAIMSDADLCILASNEETYLGYATKIWHEYKIVGEEKYIEGRLNFLRKVADNNVKIFKTPKMIEHFEQKAHMNLVNEISRLTVIPHSIIK